MEKITLSLNEVLLLEAELNGIVDSRTNKIVFAGLLAEKMSLKTKYWLTKLSDKLTSEKKTINDLRDELIKKYGKEEEDGSLWVRPFLDKDNKEANPDFEVYSKEIESLLLENKEFEYNPLLLEELGDVSSEGRYSLVFKLVKED